MLLKFGGFGVVERAGGAGHFNQRSDQNSAVPGRSHVDGLDVRHVHVSAGAEGGTSPGVRPRPGHRAAGWAGWPFMEHADLIQSGPI